MSNLDWIDSFPKTCRSLLSVHKICQSVLENMLKEVNADFKWLEEIVQVAHNMFSVKSMVLIPMPKTPCQKRRQKRVKNKVEEKYANFQPSSDLQEENGLKRCENYGEPIRPVRKCRTNAKHEHVFDGVPQRTSHLDSAVLKCTAPNKNHLDNKENLCVDLFGCSSLKNEMHITSNNGEAFNSSFVLDKKSPQKSETDCKSLKEWTDNVSPEKSSRGLNNNDSSHPTSDIYDKHLRVDTTEKLKSELQDESLCSHKLPNILDETQIIVNEVFELCGDHKPAMLKEYEIVKVKTTPVTAALVNKNITQQVTKNEYSASSTISIDGNVNTGTGKKKSNEYQDTVYAEEIISFNDLKEVSNSTVSLAELAVSSETFCKTKTQLSKERNSLDKQGPSTRTRTKQSLKPKEDPGTVHVQNNHRSEKRTSEDNEISPHPKRSCSHGIVSPKLLKYKSEKKISGIMSKASGAKSNNCAMYSFHVHNPNSGFAINGSASSFLKRNTQSTIINKEVIQEQKKLKLLEKDNTIQARLKLNAELKRLKLEELKRAREEKERKVAEAREIKLREEQQQKSKVTKKLEDKSLLTEKLIEARLKEEKEKQKLRLKKQLEADARRKQEEEERLLKQIEQEEEAKMQEKIHLRKKEIEELEKKRQVIEERKKQEERIAELNLKHHEEKLRWREKQLALEKQEKEKLEKDKRDEKERKIKEDIEKLKAMEKERLKRQEEEAKRLLHEESHLQQMIKKHNSSLVKPSAKVPFAALENNTASYNMTPAKVYNDASKDPDNYNLEDKDSEDSTDDEEAPKKTIPEWACGIHLSKALVRQHMMGVDPETIFNINCIEPPDLEKLFPGKKKRRFRERTSSAIWTSPVYKI
ncbi:inner centromere protein-like isoform X2 [Physella acuta]|uniref:inner centromere protein-like isoform X2 n=1 Tax=Physella acuta TaxID=109671 RepID=UPI0027DD1879|nr:inner centromere protein-like isoform X2 [Physella acuta]